MRAREGIEVLVGVIAVVPTAGGSCSVEGDWSPPRQLDSGQVGKIEEEKASSVRTGERLLYCNLTPAMAPGPWPSLPVFAAWMND